MSLISLRGSEMGDNRSEKLQFVLCRKNRETSRGKSVLKRRQF